MLDAGCLALRSRLSSSILRKLEGSVSFGYSSSSRLRNIVKGLLTIGSNLSQTKEFRDLFEDILAKVRITKNSFGKLALQENDNGFVLLFFCM